MKNRIIWIDWAKVIGIWLVILGHSPVLGRNTIFWYHMPFFFMLSGYHYNPCSLYNEVIKLIKRLIIPYFLYNTILLVGSSVFDKFDFFSIVNIFLGNQEALPDNYRAMWFLVSLCVIRLLYNIFKKFNIIVSTLLIIIGFLITFRWNNIPNVNDYFQFQSSLLCAPFFGIGMFLNKRQIIEGLSVNRINVFLCFCLLIFGLFIAWSNTRIIGINVFRSLYGLNLASFYISSSLICVCLIFFIKFMFSNIRISLIEDISNGTLVIVAFHQTIILLLDSIYPLNSLLSLLYSVIILFLFWLIINYSKDRFPLLIGKIK